MKKILLIFLLLPTLAFGVKHYISNTGSDSNNGHTTGAPWLTTGHACSTLAEYDTLLFMAGTYSDNLAPFSDSRIATIARFADHTTFKTAPGYDRAIITGYEGEGFGIVCRASNVVFDSLIITDSYRGIWIADDGSYVTVKNCKIYNTYLSAVDDNNNNGGVITFNDGQYIGITVRGCTLSGNLDYGQYDGVGSCMNCAGVMLYTCEACTVDANVVYNQDGGYGIRLKHGDTTCVVSNNTVYDCDIGLNNGGSNLNNKFHNNTVYDCREGMEMRNSTSANYDNNGTLIYNNTFFNNELGLHFFYDGDMHAADVYTDSSIIWNNLYVNCTVAQNLTADNWPDHIINTWSDHNAYWNGSTGNIATWFGTAYNIAGLMSTYNWDSSSVNAYPVFTDTANHDFRLTSGSPAAVKTGGRGTPYLPYMGAYAPEDTAETGNSKTYAPVRIQ